MSVDRRSIVAACLFAVACSDPNAARLKATTKATYDPKTGRLTELTYDRNKNGVVDTWTEMDGSRPLRSRTSRCGTAARSVPASRASGLAPAATPRSRRSTRS